MNALRTWWAALDPRQRGLAACAIALVLVTLLWLLAIAPALNTLRNAPAQHGQVDKQLQSMRQLAAEASALRSQRSLAYDESVRNLENSVKQTLGSAATLSINDARASLSLKAVSPDALALWLGQARINARVVPQEAHLQRSTQVAPSPATPASSSAGTGTSTRSISTVAWDGTLVLSLPARGN